MPQRHRWIFLPMLCSLAAFALIGAGSATAGKVKNVKSTVTIKSGEGTEFTGKVSAAQKACTRGRKVKLLMEPYSGGSDELVGTAKTDVTGAWEMKGSFMAGVYHAEVTSSFVHSGSDTFHCLARVGLSARF
jgi:hypothetical protein